MYDDTVIGFDKQGREVVRLNVEEPVHERPAPHPNSI
jgi:nitrate reductase beta subunit